MTAAGALMGTPPYMSPEQARGDSVHATADQYSLGCILYEMLSGSVPFQAATLRELLRLHVEAPPPALRPTGPGAAIPPSLESLVQRLLAKAPEDRFASLRELEDALQVVLKDLDGGARVPPSAMSRLAVLGVVLSVVLLTLGIGIFQKLRSRAAADRPLPSASELSELHAEALAVLRKDLQAPPPRSGSYTPSKRSPICNRCWRMPTRWLVGWRRARWSCLAIQAAGSS
jgi:serine/threonine protein kinase